jgi:hypothetical protein
MVDSFQDHVTEGNNKVLRRPILFNPYICIQMLAVLHISLRPMSSLNVLWVVPGL